MLASDWEADASIRNNSRRLGCITKWPSTKCVGVASMKACSMNGTALLLTAKWWVQMCDEPCAIGIDRLRNEAKGCQKTLILAPEDFNQMTVCVLHGG